MPSTWRDVRVFISSTFRDMHAERDWLVKRVFPALRERLVPYRIHLVDIDLRWGVTSEAGGQRPGPRSVSAADRRVPSAVCRPAGGALWLGAGGVSDEAVTKYGWIQHQTGKSITELEILYGVLRKREDAGPCVLLLS